MRPWIPLLITLLLAGCGSNDSEEPPLRVDAIGATATEELIADSASAGLTARDSGGRIVPGLPGTVTLEQPAGTEREASVVVVDPVFDAASGTFGMRLALDNPAAAIPAGQRCTVSFSLPEPG